MMSNKNEHWAYQYGALHMGIYALRSGLVFVYKKYSERCRCQKFQHTMKLKLSWFFVLNLFSIVSMNHRRWSKPNVRRFEEKRLYLLFTTVNHGPKFHVCSKLMETQKQVKTTLNIVYCVNSAATQFPIHVSVQCRLWRKVYIFFLVVVVLFVCKQCLTCIHMWRGPNLS